MKQYTEYKDSGVPWIGEIPKDWKLNKIKYSTYVKGRIGWQGLKSDEFIDKGPYLVTGTDLINGKIDWNTCYHISEERYNEAPQIQLENGDLLITKDGTIGKIAIVSNKPDKAILNSGLFVTRPLYKIYITKFMYWVLNSKVFWSYYEYLETGSTIKHLYQETFENFSFPVANIQTQQSIADFLDRKTTAIDSLIEDKQKLIELLKEKRQAIISEAVTKGLDKNAKMKDSGIEWIGEIPEDWEVKKLKQLGHIQGRIGFKGYTSQDLVEEDEAGRAIVLGGTNIMKNGTISYDKITYLSEYKFFESPEIMLTGGEILITKVGAGTGESALYKLKEDRVTINPNVMIIKPETNTNGKFINYCLLSNRIKKDMFLESNKSGAQPAINQEYVKNIRIIIPNLDEQLLITNYLDQKTAEIDNLVNDITEQIVKLKEYRQAIISEAVTGKVMV